MRHRAKIDANQTAIVTALRAAGCAVQSLATIGNGCPDILVGVRGVNYLIEIKDGSKTPSQRKLTPDEEKWHLLWKMFGQVDTAESVEQALGIIGLRERV
jgi:Holliday junction resolvase